MQNDLLLLIANHNPIVIADSRLVSGITAGLLLIVALAAYTRRNSKDVALPGTTLLILSALMGVACLTIVQFLNGSVENGNLFAAVLLEVLAAWLYMLAIASHSLNRWQRLVGVTMCFAFAYFGGVLLYISLPFELSYINKFTGPLTYGIYGTLFTLSLISLVIYTVLLGIRWLASRNKRTLTAVN